MSIIPPRLTPTTIKKTRVLSGWTKVAFADHLGVSHDAVWRWERGDAYPQATHVRNELYQLATVLDLV